MHNEAEDISETIISCLIKNSRISSQQICDELKSRGIERSPRTILERIRNLEKEGRTNYDFWSRYV